MKSLLSALLLAVCMISLHAQDATSPLGDSNNALQNGDFSSGTDHWYGDGQTSDQITSADPSAPPNPLFAKGMIMTLRPADWIKFSQDFTGNFNSGTLTITYQVTPDFALSTSADDYKNVPDKLNHDDWKAFNTEPGTWVFFIIDTGSVRFMYWKIKPKLGSGPQMIKAKVKGLSTSGDKTITVAFPPGTGSVVLLNVSLTPQ